MAPGNVAVAIVKGVTVPAGDTVRDRVAVAVCAVGVAESFTMTATEAAPTAFAAGVPVMLPVELLIESPLGKPVAEYT